MPADLFARTLSGEIMMHGLSLLEGRGDPHPYAAPGERIRQRRKEKGIRQVDLARRIGVSVDTIRRWESGTREPRAGDLKRLSAVLGCSPGELLEAHTPEKSDPRPPFDQSGPRLRRVRAALGLTQAEFGRALGGLAWHRVRDLESGKLCLPPRLAWVIEQKFKVDFRWLLTGEGPVHLDKRDDAKGAQ